MEEKIIHYHIDGADGIYHFSSKSYYLRHYLDELLNNHGLEIALGLQNNDIKLLGRWDLEDNYMDIEAIKKMIVYRNFKVNQEIFTIYQGQFSKTVETFEIIGFNGIYPNIMVECQSVFATYNEDGNIYEFPIEECFHHIETCWLKFNQDKRR